MTHTHTFFHEHESHTIHRRHRRRQFVLGCVRMFFVLFVLWLAVVLFAVGQMAASAFDVRDALADVKTKAEQQDFTSAKEDVTRVGQDLNEMQYGLSLLRRVFFIPGFREAAQGFERTLAATKQLSDSLFSLFTLAEDIVQLSGATESAFTSFIPPLSPSLSYAELSAETKRAILERLSTASHDFDLLSSRIKIANEEILALKAQPLAVPFLNTIDPFLRRMETVEKELRVASVLVHLLPELAGLSAERTHLLLFLNHDELRPGGGFIGTYGLMRLKHGEVLSLQTKDVYALDKAVSENWRRAAPAPLATSGVNPYLFFRDGNWSPDFAVSAQQLVDLFEQESSLLSDDSPIPHSRQVDSVIGFTPTFASALLKIVGPIEIGGQTYTAENVPELIEYEVEQGFTSHGILFAQRKELLADLVSEVQERLVMLPISQWADVLDAVSESIRTKQFAIYSTDYTLQKTLADVGWGAVVKPQTPDVQMLVDANLGSLKTDPAVERSIAYSLFRNESGTWIGRTAVTYQHKGTIDWRTTRYQSYARVYVPSGSQLVRVEGATLSSVTAASELGLTSFGTFVRVDPGKKETLVFEYTLSESVVQAIKQEQYALTVFKQIGARDYALTLTLDFDKNITHASPAEKRSEWGDDRYRLNTKLDQDMRIAVGL